MPASRAAKVMGINHQQTFAVSKRNHINGIENFWGYAKTKLKSYYGVSREHFYFYRKEMEFRFIKDMRAQSAADAKLFLVRRINLSTDTIPIASILSSIKGG